MQGIAAEIERLKARIADIEKRPALSSAATDAHAPSRTGCLPIPRGTLHEIFSDDLRNAGTAFGFALGQARALLGPGRPALVIAHLVHDANETGLPYAPGLGQFGIEPEAVTLVRAENVPELLWAIEEAVVCASVAAVIADIATPHKALDFTVSRRLALRTEVSGTSAFLIRYGAEREASAARYRWQVLPATSGPLPFDARAPGLPRFLATLEKGRLPGFAIDTTLTLEWTNSHGFASVDAGSTANDAAPRRGRPAPSRPQPAALGDGLSEAS